MSEQIIYLVNLAVRLEAECDRLHAENAELRAGRGRWPKEDGSSISATDTTEGVLNNRDPFARGIWADDFPCCSDTPPRLTVHKLNVAPVGSVVEHVNGAVASKYTDGRWIVHPDYPGETSEDLIEYGWADATITYPEDQR